MQEMTPERFAQLAPAIQKKILKAQAAAEARLHRKEDREVVNEWLRLAELQAIPIKERSQDEKNEFQRLYRRSKKRDEQGEPEIDERVPTAEAFWKLNRLSVGHKLAAWREIEEQVLDKIHWMNKGWATPAEDPNFVGLDEGIADLRKFAEEHGFIHDDSFDSIFLKDYLPQCGVWDQFWRDAVRFSELLAESEPTAIYAKYGIMTALPQYQVRVFLGRIKNHRNNAVNREIHREHDQGCWLCKFEDANFPAIETGESNE
jgi:hypothetical protein